MILFVDELTDSLITLDIATARPQVKDTLKKVINDSSWTSLPYHRDDPVFRQAKMDCLCHGPCSQTRW